MFQRLKQIGCYLTIIVLLPYVITVFINGPMTVTLAGTDDTRIRVDSDGKQIEMLLEEYCIGRLAREMPVNFEEEALKAQAVLVRTSVYGKILESGSGTVLPDEFWTTDEMSKQWNGNYRANYQRIERAWRETEGKVLMYGDKPANVPYFRLSNGNTRDGKEVLGSEEYPYLKIRDCPLDIESKEQIQTVVLEDLDAEVTKADSAGYALEVRVGKETVQGEEFRNTYELASSCFTLQKYEGKLRVTTRGAGHGLGMSQYTANRMAKNKKSFEEILAYFFEGTEIREVADIVTDVE